MKNRFANLSLILERSDRKSRSDRSLDNKGRAPGIVLWFIRGLLCITLLFGATVMALGQMSELETNQGIDASIAPYDANVRESILQVSQYPQVLSQLQTNQSQTAESFHDIIGGFDKKKQAWFYTITRYPELMHTLATLPEKTDKGAVYKLLPNQDADLKEAAWQLYHSKKNDLIKLDNIDIAAKQDFDKAIQSLSAPAQAAFQKLYNMPDVLTLLTNNIDLTTRLGEHYKANPTTLNGRLSDIHDSLVVQDQYEIAAYKKQMADDPKAQDELSQAANAYAKDNGYDVPAQQYDDADNENYYANPYSYWFGYPGWYSDPLWYPGSFWFDTGLYFGVGGFGIWGMPGYGFSSWFFGSGHYNHYPNLYRQFGNYYRNNIAENRVMGSANRGFMGVANTHFNTNGGNQLNRRSSPSTYSRVNPQSAQTNRGKATRVNANSYHAQSWRSFGGRSNAFRSSGGGGGFRGGGGGGSRGGGGRH